MKTTQNTNTPTQNIMDMSRSDLESSDVEAAVAKWGEAERAGCVKQTAAKHIDTLRMAHAHRIGLSDFRCGRTTRNIATGSLSKGHS